MKGCTARNLEWGDFYKAEALYAISRLAGRIHAPLLQELAIEVWPKLRL